MTLSRREFIRSSTAFCASAALAGCASLHPGAQRRAVVGSNIYGWGQYAQRDKRKLNLDEVLDALRDCSYDYLENFMNVPQPEENAAFAEKLKARGMQPVSLYVGARVHESGKAAETVEKIVAAARVCRQAGFQVLSCNAEPIGREKTDAELATQAAAFKDLGEGLAGLGMQLGIHHHMPEMANNAREFHYNFDHTPPAVGFCYDVHWVWKGGVQPLDALRQYGSRVVTWHLRQSRNRVWWEDLDTGDIDYSAVATFAAQHRLPRRYTVELALEPGTKITRSVVENHRRCREFVRRVFQA